MGGGVNGYGISVVLWLDRGVDASAPGSIRLGIGYASTVFEPPVLPVFRNFP